eukprot:COSAG05_NODE_3649_length_1932_cov_1.097109_1_plen_112_part_00
MKGEGGGSRRWVGALVQLCITLAPPRTSSSTLTVSSASRPITVSVSSRLKVVWLVAASAVPTGCTHTQAHACTRAHRAQHHANAKHRTFRTQDVKTKALQNHDAYVGCVRA